MKYKYNRVPDKEISFKKDYTIKCFKTITEDKGGPVETWTLEDCNGRILSEITKKDGELRESSATTDAQNSGIFAEFAKKAGVKEEELTYTQVKAATAQMVVEEHEGKNDLKKSGGDVRKTFMDLAKRCWKGYKPVPGKKPYSEGSCVKKSGGIKVDDLKKFLGKKEPKRITQMREENRSKDYNKEIDAKAESIKQQNRPDQTSLEDKVKARYGLKKDDENPSLSNLGDEYFPEKKKEPKTLNYAEMNKKPKPESDDSPSLDYGSFNKPKPRSTDLDYSKFNKKPVEKEPRWKKDMRLKREAKRKDIVDKHGVKGPAAIDTVESRQKTKKSDSRSRFTKLAKDVIDFKSRQKLGDTGGSGKPAQKPAAKQPDTRSTDQKIKDALNQYGDTRGHKALEAKKNPNLGSASVGHDEKFRQAGMGGSSIEHAIHKKASAVREYLNHPGTTHAIWEVKEAAQHLWPNVSDSHADLIERRVSDLDLEAFKAHDHSEYPQIPEDISDDTEKSIELEKDNQPHPEGSPEDAAHDVAEGASLKTELKSQVTAKNMKRLLAHLRNSKKPGWQRSEMNKTMAAPAADASGMEGVVGGSTAPSEADMGADDGSIVMPTYTSGQF